MDLFCPHCTQRVTIPDDQGGQITNCPLCAKQFQAPSLAPPPAASAAPPSAGYGTGPAPPPAAVAPPTPSQPAPASPPPPPGEYTRSCSCELTGDWLAFVPTACLVLIFFLSLFTWHNIDRDHMPGLWGLSFVDQKMEDVKQGHFLAYTILMMFPVFPLTLAALVLEKMLAPPQLTPIIPWKDLVVGLLLGLTFLFLLFDYADAHLLQHSNPIALALKLAIRLHFLAMAASFVMFWLHWRKRYNLPAPKCEARW